MLRKLQKKDAERMLEWMHNFDTTEYLATNFASKTLVDCERFIELAQESDNDLHLAVVSDCDLYLGTVSLKNIHNGCAEFAITLHPEGQGTGLAKKAMTEILKLGHDQFGLKEIYWCVSPLNKRAVRFYDKAGYKRINYVPQSVSSPYGTAKLIWYRA